MAAIRIPESAESLLPLCRTSGTAGPHIWETYADMISFVAAYAYGQGELPAGAPRLMKSGNPIDLGVFRSRGLYPILLTLAIADRRDWLVAKGADEIAAIVERYADVGAKLLGYQGGSIDVVGVGERLLSDLHQSSNSSPVPAIGAKI